MSGDNTFDISSTYDMRYSSQHYSYALGQFFMLEVNRMLDGTQVIMYYTYEYLKYIVPIS